MDQVEAGQEFPVEPPYEPVSIEPPTGNSLAARMEQAAAELAKQQTQLFPVPGIGHVLEVELRSLNQQTLTVISDRLERVRHKGTKLLYMWADSIAAATVQLHMVPEVGGKPQPIEQGWIEVAKLRAMCPDSPTVRQAIIFLVSDERLRFLVEDWEAWNRTKRADIAAEVDQDFAATG